MADMDFRRKTIEYKDDWRGGKVRIARYMGSCALCGIRTYGFDDGEDDPRGPLGDHANASMMAADFGMTGPDVPACFTCQNDTVEKYNRLVKIAKRRWH